MDEQVYINVDVTPLTSIHAFERIPTAGWIKEERKRRQKGKGRGGRKWKTTAEEGR